MQNKTIAQQLNVKEFPFDIEDKNGNLIYSEDSTGFWWKNQCDNKGNVIYSESSNGDWLKTEYDENNNVIYHEDSDKYWFKREVDENGNEIYFENSKGIIINTRPKIKEVTMDEVAKAFGVSVEYLKIKE